MADLKQFFDALNDRPLKPTEEADRRVYVDNLHVTHGSTDTILELCSQMQWEEPGRAYLFTGQRGTGKSTELFRLKAQLEKANCAVFYVDIGDFLLLTDQIALTDFLAAVLGGWSEAIANTCGGDVLGEGYLTRFWKFLQSDVQLKELSLGTKGPVEADLKLALQSDASFKQIIRDKSRGHTSRFIQDARAFVRDTVTRLKAKLGDKRIVVIVDSFERIRGGGTGAEAEAVFTSVAEMFGQQSDNLRFEGVQIVYTVPPWLLAISGSLGAYYGGGSIFALSSLHLFRMRIREVEPGGLELMRTILTKRYPEWGKILPEDIFVRFATMSGGDLRDFFRLIRVSLGKANTRAAMQGKKEQSIDGAIAAETLASIRREMLPLANDDLAWLRKIAENKQPNLPDIKQLAVLARYFDSKLVLNYRNGDDWYDVHPLIRDDVRERT